MAIEIVLKERMQFAIAHCPDVFAYLEPPHVRRDRDARRHAEARAQILKAVADWFDSQMVRVPPLPVSWPADWREQVIREVRLVAMLEVTNRTTIPAKPPEADVGPDHIV